MAADPITVDVRVRLEHPASATCPCGIAAVRCTYHFPHDDRKPLETNSSNKPVFRGFPFIPLPNKDMPELVVSMPSDWSSEQIARFQRFWDELCSAHTLERAT